MTRTSVPRVALLPDQDFRGFRSVVANYERAGESMFLTFQERVRRARGARVEAEPVAIREGARFTYGRKLPELQPLLWTNDGYPLVTSAVLDVLAPFTGWTTYPVNIVSQEKKSIPGYIGLAITGRCGRVLPDFSRIEEHNGRTCYVGSVYDPESWDGSDIVWPVRGTGILVTQPVADALAPLELTSTRFAPISDLKWDQETTSLMREYKTAQYNERSDDWLWEPSLPRPDKFRDQSTSEQ